MTTPVELISELSEDERSGLAVLLRGVAHSSPARSQFNEFCHARGVEPNELLAHVRDGHAPLVR